MTDLSPIWISLKTATVATAIAFWLGIAIAGWMLDYKGKFKGAIDGLLTAPLVLPPTVVGFLLLLLLGRNGFIGQILAYFGINIVFTWYATVIAATVVAFPLMYKTTLGAFKQIDRNLIACAKTLGADRRRIFWQIIIPLAKPGLIAGTLLTFARALGEFGATIMLAGSIPGKTETIPIAIFLAASGGAMDRALILVLIMLVISLSVMIAVDRWSDTIPQVRRRKRRLRLEQLKLEQLRLPVKKETAIPPQLELVVNIQKQLADFYLDVSFTADRAPLGLLGASGAGKSLILRCIAGLETPDRGQIILNGRVLYDSSKKINLPPRDRACGFLFQNYALFPHLTVAENIAFGMPIPPNQQEIARYLATVDLLGMENRYPRELSGGQQQRVALARAKASQASILLLDEPFSALDIHLRDSQVQLLNDNLLHYTGITLFVTHNLEEAYRVCKRLLVIDRGKAIAIGKKDDIFNHPPNLTTARLIGCKNFSRAVAISDRHIKAIDWDCILEVSQPIPESLSYVGIHPHQIVFSNCKTVNTFPCWLASTSETQHHITFYLKLNSPAQNTQDYHLQAELLKHEARKLEVSPFPWQIMLDSQQIMLF